MKGRVEVNILLQLLLSDKMKTQYFCYVKWTFAQSITFMYTMSMLYNLQVDTGGIKMQYTFFHNDDIPIRNTYK